MTATVEQAQATMILGRAMCPMCTRSVYTEVAPVPKVTYRPIGAVMLIGYAVIPGQRCGKCESCLDAAKVVSPRG